MRSVLAWLGGLGRHSSARNTFDNNLAMRYGTVSIAQLVAEVWVYGCARTDWRLSVLAAEMAVRFVGSG
ncbi:hypothetical protein D9M68_980810 [compost metagenome]